MTNLVKTVRIFNWLGYFLLFKLELFSINYKMVLSFELLYLLCFPDIPLSIYLSTAHNQSTPG